MIGGCYSGDMQQRKHSYGFTIVEIAVVIVVLGILLTMTAIGYRTVQDQARGAEVSTALRAVESAFHTFSANQNRQTWVNETEFLGTAAPSLSTFLAPSFTPTGAQTAVIELRRQLPQGIPTVDGFEAITWTYRNTGTVRTTSACDQTINGALILLTGVPKSVATQMDQAIDDGQETCGKVRYTSGGQLLYQLGFTQTVTN